MSRTAGIAIVLVLLGRAVVVYVLCPLFSRSHSAVPRSYQHILVWGGLRGAFALVLVLTLPNTIDERREIVIAHLQWSLSQSLSRASHSPSGTH
jgi:CPA1 family monovalent cation:H+ antiporter